MTGAAIVPMAKRAKHANALSATSNSGHHVDGERDAHRSSRTFATKFARINFVPISFCKFHGFGNDYIVIEKDQIGDADVSDLAMAICNRHTGAGGDGIAVLEMLDGERADYFCEIVNPDGSIAGFFFFF